MPQLRLRTAPVGDVARDARRADHRVVGVEHGAHAPLHHERDTVHDDLVLLADRLAGLDHACFLREQGLQRIGSMDVGGSAALEVGGRAPEPTAEGRVHLGEAAIAVLHPHRVGAVVEDRALAEPALRERCL